VNRSGVEPWKGHFIS